MNKLIILLLLIITPPVWAQQSFEMKINNVMYQVFKLQASSTDVSLQMHWKTKEGEVIGKLENIENELPNNTVLLATNGGIYSSQYAPEGLYIEAYKEILPLNIQKGNGNFYMQPNAVFSWSENQTSAIVSSQNWESYKAQHQVKYAVQSGPLLLQKKRINPKFRKESTSKYIRNGVGIDSLGNTYFVCSKSAVNFYTFSSLFKEQLHCHSALYLDGAISNMQINNKQLRRSPAKYASIISVSKKRKVSNKINMEYHIIPNVKAFNVENREGFNENGLFWDVKEKYSSHLKLITTLQPNYGDLSDEAILIQKKDSTVKILSQKEWKTYPKEDLQNALQAGVFLYNQNTSLNPDLPIIKKAILIGIKEEKNTEITILYVTAKENGFHPKAIYEMLSNMGFVQVLLCSYDQYAEVTIPRNLPNWDVKINKDIKKLLIIQ